MAHVCPSICSTQIAPEPPFMEVSSASVAAYKNNQKTIKHDNHHDKINDNISASHSQYLKNSSVFLVKEFETGNDPILMSQQCNNIEIPIRSIYNINQRSTKDANSKYVFGLYQYGQSVGQGMMKIIGKGAKGIFVIDFEKDGNVTSGLYCILISLVVISLSVPLTIVPQHNILKFPEYWPEYWLNYLVILLAYASNHVFDCFLVMNNNDMFSIKIFVGMYANLLGAMMLASLMINVIWIYVLNFHPPIPCFGIMLRSVAFVVNCTVLWFQHPITLRSDLCFRKRLKSYLVMRVVRQCMFQAYVKSAILFEMVPAKFQFVLAFALPILRYGNSWVQHKIADKAKGSIESANRFAVNCYVACTHALYLSIIIGSKATDITSYLICGIDVILNMKLCYKIVRIYKRHGKILHAEIQNDLQTLVMKETLELLLPILYCIMFSMAYFGPNAEIMGNIKNDYWQYKKVEDVTIPLSKIGVFLFIDLLRIMLSSFILWKCCRINFFSEYCRMMDIYWKAITSYIALYLLAVS